MSAHSGRVSNSIPIENCYRAWGSELVTKRTHQSLPVARPTSFRQVPAVRPTSASEPPQQTGGQQWDQFGLAGIPAAHLRAGLNGNKNPRR
jgi:hypothetical protein